MNLGGGMLAAPAPGSALRLCFERVVSLDSPAAPAACESQEAAALPDPLDAPSFGLLDAAPSLSQDAGLFWCGEARLARAGGSPAAHRGFRRLMPPHGSRRSTPDFITPQDHQFGCAYSTAEKARAAALWQRRASSLGPWCRLGRPALLVAPRSS